MQFEFATATRILFGPGTLGQVAPLAAEMLCGAGYRHALVVTRANLGQAASLIQSLAEHQVRCITLAVASEPTVEMIRRGTEVAAGDHCALVLAIGGGSVIDAGKAIAALLTNPGDPLDYLEVIGAGRPLTQPPVPLIAIPTTSGTGAEVTRNSVLASEEHKVKVSLRDARMLPRLAVVDPQLTYDLPPEVTAQTGLDALTQLSEAFVGTRANPVTDALSREGMALVARSLRRAYQQADDPAAREDMSLAALLGGLALANAGLGAVHGLAGPLGGMFAAPHGGVCAALLPHVMAANLCALEQRRPHSPALVRYVQVARILTGDPQARAADAVAWVGQLSADLHIPPLRAYGVTPDHFQLLAEKAASASSMKPNPISLTPVELQSILAHAL